MLVETQVLSTLPPGSPNLHPPYLSPQPLPPYLSPQPLPPILLPFPSDLIIYFESTSVMRSSQAFWIQVLLKQSSQEQRELEFRVKMLKWDCSSWQWIGMPLSPLPQIKLTMHCSHCNRWCHQSLFVMKIWCFRPKLRSIMDVGPYVPFPHRAVGKRCYFKYMAVDEAVVCSSHLWFWAV